MSYPPHLYKGSPYLLEGPHISEDLGTWVASILGGPHICV